MCYKQIQEVCKSFQKEVMSKWSPEEWEELAQGGMAEVSFRKRRAYVVW